MSSGAGGGGWQAVQRAFARHLRDPDRHPPPGVLDPERVAIYRDAVFANMHKHLADNFPLLARLIGEERVRALVREFLATHRSHTLRYVALPAEFLDFLAARVAGPGWPGPPFALELARFEFLETELGADPRRLDLAAIDRDGDLLAGVPVLNPIHRLVRYQWPVHRLAVRPDAPLERAPVTLAAFRAPDNRFGFVELNAASARLVELMAEGRGESGRALLTRLAWELKGPPPEAVIGFGSELLERMRARGLVLGTRAGGARAPSV